MEVYKSLDESFFDRVDTQWIAARFPEETCVVLVNGLDTDRTDRHEYRNGLLYITLEFLPSEIESLPDLNEKICERIRAYLARLNRP